MLHQGNTMTLVRKEILRYKDAKTDKVYEIELIEERNEHFVNFKYGKLGSKLRSGTKTKTRVAKKKAHKIFDDLIKEKKKKGYKVWSGQELNEVQTIIEALNNTGISVTEESLSLEVREIDGSIGDIICVVLEEMFPKSFVSYPTFDGGWDQGTVAEEYGNLVKSIVSNSNGKIEVSELKVSTDDNLKDEDSQEITISFKHSEKAYGWTFCMDDAYVFFNGVTKWITDALGGGYIYLSNDAGIYGFFLPVKTIKSLIEIGVEPDKYSLEDDSGFIDLAGKHISFAVFKDRELVEDWAEELEIYGAFPQYVINDKTEIVLYGDFDHPPCAAMNDDKILKEAKSKGVKMLSFFDFQDLMEQFEY